MPPKRQTRAAAATAAAQPAAITASQPEPQRPSTRASARKRRHSDGSDTSNARSSSQVKVAPAKRGRPKKSAAEQEVIVEEEGGEEEVMGEGESERAGPGCAGASELRHQRQAGELHDTDEGDGESIHVAQKATTSTTTNTKRVHFGGDSTAEEEEEDLLEESTATFITPHPHTKKMTIKRRRTASPTEEESSVKRLKVTRTSLPASLSQHKPTDIIQELRFAPLRNVLEERIRRLSLLRREVADDDEGEGTGDGDGDVPMMDSDALVLDGAEEMSIAQLPAVPLHTPIGSRGLVFKTKNSAADVKEPITPGARDRADWNTERKKFQTAILTLQKEADEARAQIQVLDLELESMGFAAKEGTDSLAILHTIRESFARVREFLETELPGSLPDDASNEDLTEILVANVREFAERLRTADRELNSKSQLVGDLGGQVNGLLDRLARREIDNTELANRITQLDGFNIDKDRDIAELEEDLRTTTKQRNDLEKKRDEEAARADGLDTENEELERNLRGLSEKMVLFHGEEKRLSEKINVMEEEHRVTVEAMNREREGAVRDLEERLDIEMSQHGEAVKLGDERQKAIEELRSRIEETSIKRDDFQDQLEKMTAERDKERATREELEGTLEEKIDENDDHEACFSRAQDQLEDYSRQLDELRQLLENERNQHEAAEKDLDTRNAIIVELDEKLREEGKQANELRQKLFEVQIKNAEKIKELETAASERDQQYQEDMAAEVARREGAEDLAKERENTFLDLQQQLEEVEKRMRSLLAEKDEEMERLKDELEQRDAEIQNLNDDLRSTKAEYEGQLEQNLERTQDLEAGIAELHEDIAEHEGTIRTLEQEAIDQAQNHALQIETRDAKLAVLNDQLAELKVQKDDLSKERTKLEQKVEHEAENMLQFQNETTAEIENLKHTIRDKQSKIQAVDEKVRETDRQWEAVLAAREEEIQALTLTAEKQNKTIDHLAHRFGDYVRRSSSFIAKLQEQVGAARVFVDGEGRELQSEGEGLLEVMEIEMLGSGEDEEEIRVSGRERGEVVKNGKGKGRKRREYDSGVGLVNGSSSPVRGGAGGGEMLLS